MQITMAPCYPAGLEQHKAHAASRLHVITELPVTMHEPLG